MILYTNYTEIHNLYASLKIKSNNTMGVYLIQSHTYTTLFDKNALTANAILFNYMSSRVH